MVVNSTPLGVGCENTESNRLDSTLYSVFHDTQNPVLLQYVMPFPTPPPSLGL